MKKITLSVVTIATGALVLPIAPAEAARPGVGPITGATGLGPVSLGTVHGVVVTPPPPNPLGGHHHRIYGVPVLPSPPFGVTPPWSQP
jgi:hypothetical protein